VKALIVGKRASVMSELAAALADRGHEVTVAAVDDIQRTLANTSSLRSTRDPFGVDGARFDVVAFGRAVKDDLRRAVMDRVRSRNPRAQRVDGLAPVPALLVVQCEWAARRASGAADADPRVLVEAVPVPRVVVRPVADGAQVEVLRHRLSPWFSTRSEALPMSREGTDAAAYFGRGPGAKRDFISVRVDGEAVFVGDSLGRLPLCQ
jgi:hypothetical protein